jgi:hypothetical protein
MALRSGGKTAKYPIHDLGLAVARGMGQVLEGLHKPSSRGAAMVWLGRQAKRRPGRLFLGLGVLCDDGQMVVNLHESLLLSISSLGTEGELHLLR